MRIKAVIWDLDGTLLDTLQDLAASVNAALARNALPSRSLQEVRAFVGDGVRKLVERAVPEGAPECVTEAVFAAFVSHYGAHSRDATRPYDGILPMLDQLGEMGIQSAVVSNKIDFAVRDLCAFYFGGRILAAVGDAPGRRKKPAPDGVLEAMRLLGARKEETVYAGDSQVDILTAKNAGIPCLSAGWGFRGEAELKLAGAKEVYPTPQALLEALARL